MNGMKSIYSIFLLVFLGSFVLNLDAKAETKEEEKVISISPIQEDEIISLDGKWELYWNALYTPNDFHANNIGHQPLIVEVPNTWTEYQRDGKNLPGEGYATYRIQLQFPKEEVGRTIAVYMPSVASAYTLWVDGEIKSFNGKVGKDRGTMVPENVPKIFSFQVREEKVEFLLQVSNFNQRKAGIYDSILLGEQEEISTYRDKKIIYRSMIVTSLLIMGIYHIVLYLYRKKELPFIFFGIACVSVATRSILLEGGLASYLLVFLDWEIACKLEYMGGSIGIMFFSLFTYTQFKEDMSRTILNLIIVLMSLYSAFLWVTPAIVFTKTMVILQVTIMIIFLYLLVVYVKALINKREGALLNAFAILLFFLTYVNDFLYFNFFIRTAELSSFGLLFFLFTQSILIARRYSKSFVRSEKLSQDLERLNESLEQQVLERTMEIQETNKELQEVNRKLNEVSYWRVMWLRNISHDIATPLTGIRAYSKGILDGVVPNEKKYIQLIYDQSTYLSQMLHDLHDIPKMNNGKINIETRRVEIKSYIEGIYRKYQIDIEEQGIEFTYQDKTQTTMELFILLDPVKIEQVIVNFIKNAERFVNEVDGEIRIQLEKESDDFIKVKVQDNGIGIKEEELELIFGRFYTGSNQEKTHDGSGLGLTIAKEIIETHNGQIGVQSIYGEGSCFYFTLPIIKEGI